MELFAGWTPKDWMALGALAVSVLALLVSALSYAQKAEEGRSALRKQLTDTLHKLSDLKIDVVKYRALSEEEKSKLPSNYISFFNEQQRFLVRQGTHLAEQLPELVNRFEYLLLAEGANSVDEIEQAEALYKTASRPLPLTAHIKSLLFSLKPARSVERGIALRNYGTYLFTEARRGDAAKKFKAALTEFNGENDRQRSYRASTYELWAELERSTGNARGATQLLTQAVREYDSFSNSRRARAEKSRIEEHLQRL